MSGQVSLYFREDQVIVIPQGGGGGFSYDIEPSLVVEPAPDEVGLAIADALAVSAAAQGHDGTAPDTSPTKSPLLKRLGLRSFKAFYRGASHIYLYDEEGTLVMLKFHPAADGKGFELDSSPPETITDRRDAGRIVLEHLQRAPRMS